MRNEAIKFSETQAARQHLDPLFSDIKSEDAGLNPVARVSVIIGLLFSAAIGYVCFTTPYVPTYVNALEDGAQTAEAMTNVK